MLTRVHHVGIVVEKLEDGLALWQDALGLHVSAQATVKDQGVKAALLPIGHSEIELLEPVVPNTGVAKFLEKRGGGLHHVCFETPDVGGELARARDAGFPLIDEAPRPGLAGMICFLHPKGTRGVLVEFATPPPGSHHHGECGHGATAGLALHEVTCRTKDAAAAATVYRDQLGLAGVSMTPRPGAAVHAVEVGGVRLCFLSADPSTGSAEATALQHDIEANGEGIAGLVLDVRDVSAAAAALTAYGPTTTATGFHLDPARCHRVPLSFQALRG